jgi:hypothetical protein
MLHLQGKQQYSLNEVQVWCEFEASQTAERIKVDLQSNFH